MDMVIEAVERAWEEEHMADHTTGAEAQIKGVSRKAPVDRGRDHGESAERISSMSESLLDIGGANKETGD